jgi:fucose permease
MEKTAAASAASLFLGGMVLGRIAGSRLTRRIAPARILIAAVILALTGFLLFWLAPTRSAGGLPALVLSVAGQAAGGASMGQALTLAGLFLAGLGMANVFPLALAGGTGAAPDRLDLASARISLGSGLAILLAPLTLGWVADNGGIAVAFALVAVLLALAAVVSWAAARWTGDDG